VGEREELNRAKRVLLFDGQPVGVVAAQKETSLFDRLKLNPRKPGYRR
jgi:hypothetical protein